MPRRLYAGGQKGQNEKCRLSITGVIRGTVYENYAESFVGAHNADEVRRMKIAVDQRERDCRILLGSVGDVDRGMNPITRKPMIFGKPWFQACNTLSFSARITGFFIIRGWPR